MELFRYQAEHNPVYKEYIRLLKVAPFQVKKVEEIPFLPISTFKTHKVKTGEFTPQSVFTSSGTTGMSSSRHEVADVLHYENIFFEGFKKVYGKVSGYCVLALLPSYLERSGSSLIHMADSFIKASKDPDSAFYLNEWDKLYEVIQKKIESGKKTLLLGVSFALLDFAERYQLPANDLVIMETGGMKGRRKEMVRSELHDILTTRLGVKAIHSEYGMTELMSQAYSKGEGRFHTPPWMRVMIRQVDDPFTQARVGKTGGINIIDLGNVDSCAFIETQDLGRLHGEASFEVMGRFDNADIRGCNLMVI